MTNDFSRLVAPPEKPAGQLFFSGAVAISLVLHAVVAVALIDQVKGRPHEAEVSAVVVELVPPPELEQPEPDVPEPEPPQPPEPEVPEPEVAEPPAPEPPAPEPPPETPDQPQPEEQLAELSPPLRVLQPVYEFGETDTGPQTDQDGVAAPEPSEAEQDQPEPNAIEADGTQNADSEPAEEQPPENAVAEEEVAEEEVAEEEVAEEKAAEEKAAEEEASEEAVAEVSAEPEAEQPEVPEPVLGPEQTADTTAESSEFGIVGPITALVTPTPRPERNPVRNPAPAAPGANQSLGSLPGVRTLSSAVILDDPRLRRAMSGMPRAARANLLCMTRMRDQLRAAEYPPDALPSIPRLTGTVLEANRVAFRSRGQWFDFAFRCEVDEGVMRVVKFDYQIGNAIPPSQWVQRGLPRL